MLTLRDSPDEARFREEVVEWANAELLSELAWRTDFESRMRVDRLLATASLMAVGWPSEYGGRELPPSLEAVLTEELAVRGVIRSLLPSHQGVNNFGPTLMVHGSDAQKLRWLPAILTLDHLWCQGFSEPDAGSDLASVRTMATPDGDDLVVNGVKLWTSHAVHANWIYALVRTGRQSDRHRGLSFVVMPMDSPGLTWSPIENIVGDSTFCQVYFDDVRAPAENVIGGVGHGWRVAMRLLASERLTGRYRYGLFRRELNAIGNLIARAGIDDSQLLGEFGRSVAQIEAIAALSRRADSVRAMGRDIGALSSINKLWWPLAHQHLTEVGLLAAAQTGARPDEFYRGWLAARPESVYGGSAQIQRNIIAERFLGMPRSR